MAQKIGQMPNTQKDTLSVNNGALNTINPWLNLVIKAFVLLIDLAIMILLIANVITSVIPVGSWLNYADGDSMFPTIHDRQILFVDSGEIERGDIISSYVPVEVLRNDPVYHDMVLLKRVVGLPGDSVVINETGIYINGEILVEDYLTKESIEATYGDWSCLSIQLDDDEYFVMGDNREISYDSRSFGALPKDDILYKESELPTIAFCLKCLFLVVVLFLSLKLSRLIERTLNLVAHKILFKVRLY